MGIRSDDLKKNIISYLVESHNVTIENINKFDIRDESYTDNFEIFKHWIRNGKIICGESISYEIKYSLLSLEEKNYLVLKEINLLFNF